jgi:hypothetical protein
MHLKEWSMMSRVAGGQMFLLPQEPRELADHIGLDWWAARKLHDDQWLSFDPEKMLIESDAMRAEFPIPRFPGCCRMRSSFA